MSILFFVVPSLVAEELSSLPATWSFALEGVTPVFVRLLHLLLLSGRVLTTVLKDSTVLRSCTRCFTS